MTCYMCHRAPRPMTAHRDGDVYSNAVDVVLFCSIRCAANYGLLWGVPAVFDNEHYCEVDGQWLPIPASDCSHCNREGGRTMTRDEMILLFAKRGARGWWKEEYSTLPPKTLANLLRARNVPSLTRLIQDLEEAHRAEKEGGS
jgi:hypothetical protein